MRADEGVGRGARMRSHLAEKVLADHVLVKDAEGEHAASDLVLADKAAAGWSPSRGSVSRALGSLGLRSARVRTSLAGRSIPG